MALTAIEGVVVEGGTAYLMARILAGDGEPAVEADINAISYTTAKVNPPTSKQNGGWQNRYIETSSAVPYKAVTALTVSAVMFDTLQTDDRWTVDATGYNFLAEIGPGPSAGNFDAIPLSSYPKSQWYEIVVMFDPTSGTDFPAVFHIEQKSSTYGK